MSQRVATTLRVVLILGVGLLAGTTQASASVPKSAVAEPPTTTGRDTGCRDVRLVGVAGSGEQREGGWGFGPTIRAFDKELEGRMGNLTLAHDFVRYDPEPATFTNLGDVLVKGESSAFLKGFRRGVLVLKQLLLDRHVSCPREVLVLAGYSQGAMVVVEGLVELITAGDSEVVERVAGVSLVANPFAERSDSSILVGTAEANHKGIYNAIGRPAKLGSRWLGTVFEGCNRNDAVCDFRDWETAKKLKAAIEIHSSYAAGDATVLKRLAELTILRIRRVPRDAAQVVHLVKGESGSALVTPKGGDRPQLVWSPSYQSGSAHLPPGVSFVDGVLQGRPTAVGTWSTTLSVFNRQVAPRSVAEIKLTVVVTEGLPATSLEGVDPIGDVFDSTTGNSITNGIDIHWFKVVSEGDNVRLAMKVEDTANMPTPDQEHIFGFVFETETQRITAWPDPACRSGLCHDVLTFATSNTDDDSVEPTFLCRHMGSWTADPYSDVIAMKVPKSCLGHDSQALRVRGYVQAGFVPNYLHDATPDLGPLPIG